MIKKLRIHVSRFAHIFGYKKVIENYKKDERTGADLLFLVCNDMLCDRFVRPWVRVVPHTPNSRLAKHVVCHPYGKVTMYLVRRIMKPLMEQP